MMERNSQKGRNQSDESATIEWKPSRRNAAAKLIMTKWAGRRRREAGISSDEERRDSRG